MQIRPRCHDLSIVLSGEAGQGIQTVEAVLMRALKSSGFHCFSTSEFMSRIRGGNNSTMIRVSPCPATAFVERIDLFLPLGQGAMERFKDRITEHTLVIGETENLDPVCTEKGCRVIEIPLSGTALEAGDARYANSVLTGLLLELLRCDDKTVLRYYHTHYSDDSEIIEGNLKALALGRALGKKITEDYKLSIVPDRDPAADDLLVMTGSEAAGAGALAGGCTFIASYPMSPSTGILVFLARNARRFSIVAEQAEDEIAAVNMALGAWYAGARAMVTTSGGGFALMTEGLSLAGAMELPLVVNLAQRPGPATGLPTRTEQGDLNMALYSGHGEFPRIILAPKDAQDAFELTARAFELADRFQVPVILLTDQYLLDSTWTVAPPEISDMTFNPGFTRTTENYMRYRITGDCISPRGIPGFGDGIVCCDSDEHCEAGYITEDPEMRVRMVNKRMEKMKHLESAAIPPLTINPKGKNVILSWGSTWHAIVEALGYIDRDDICILHLNQVFPLHPDVKRILENARRITAIENNASGQLASLVEAETKCRITNRILKYDGHPFSVEGIAASLEKTVFGG